MKSTLVIILSETRGHEHTFNLFKSNLLDVLQADLCLCIADNHREEKKNPFYQNAKYIWVYKEPFDWGDAFDDAQSIEGYKGNWRKLLEVKNQWLGGIKGKEAHPGSAGILLFFRWFLKKSIIDNQILDLYDRFVVTRSDFVHRIPHVPIEFLDPNFVWIPDGEDYGGFTDRHIVAHRRDIIDVLSITDPIIANPDDLYSKMIHSKNWNLEKYIKFSFRQLGLTSKVRRFPYTMYSIRTVDGHTRWKKGTFIKKFGYYIKYLEEYESFFLVSKIIKKAEDWTVDNISLLNRLILINRKIKRMRKSSFFGKRFVYSLWERLVWRNQFDEDFLSSLYD